MNEEVTPEVEQPVVEAPTTESAEPTPHPLQPGGPRFEEIYARMKSAEERALRYEGMMQAQQQPRPQPQAPTVYTPQMLQSLIDQGRLTPMEATDILAKQNSIHTATTLLTASQRAQQQQAKLENAAQEVKEYLARVPALKDSSSKDFTAVAETAHQLSQEFGLHVNDPRIQAQALRAHYGPASRLASADQTRRQSREASLPHVETRAGGRPASTPASTSDVLKNIDPAYIAFWQRRGYTEEQMREEAKFIPAGRKVRPGARS